MKTLLAILSCLIILIGLKSLRFAYAVVGDFSYADFNPLMLIILLPSLLISFVAIKYPITYLIKRNASTAYPLAIITGVAVWLLLNSPTMDYIDYLDSINQVEDDDSFFPEGFVFFPVILGMLVTGMMRSGIKKSFPALNSEQDGAGQSAAAPQLKSD